MTTQTKRNDTPRLYRMLESMDREIRAIGTTVRGMNESVGDLLTKTDSIYDAVTRHPESRYDGLGSDSFLSEAEE